VVEQHLLTVLDTSQAFTKLAEQIESTILPILAESSTNPEDVSSGYEVLQGAIQRLSAQVKRSMETRRGSRRPQSDNAYVVDTTRAMPTESPSDTQKKHRSPRSNRGGATYVGANTNTRIFNEPHVISQNISSLQDLESMKHASFDTADVPYEVNRNGNFRHVVVRRTETAAEWHDLRPSTSVECNGTAYSIGDTIAVMIEGQNDEGYARIREIRHFHDVNDGVFFLVAWCYNSAEAAEVLPKSQRKKLLPHSRLYSTHLDVISGESVIDRTEEVACDQVLDISTPPRLVHVSNLRVAWISAFHGLPGTIGDCTADAHFRTVGSLLVVATPQISERASPAQPGLGKPIEHYGITCLAVSKGKTC